MAIQAVFFDVGGTIETFWYNHELRSQTTEDLRKRLLQAGIDLNLSSEGLYTLVTQGLARYRRWCMQSLVELPAERVWGEYILADYPMALQQLGSVAEELSLFIETRCYRREMRPEMPEVLEAIRGLGLKMGIISNVQSRGLVPTNLEQYGIKHFFDPIVLSSVYGRRKPDPAIFHHAAHLAVVPTGACVHVGDRISRDILGARRAGYHLAIQIRHQFDDGDDDADAVPDAVLDDMTELVDILEDELRRSAGGRATAGAGCRQVRAILFDAADLLYFRPNKGQRLNAFLGKLGLDPGDVAPGEQRALKTRAFLRQIDLDEYREELLKLYGVQGREQIEYGKGVLEEESSDIQFFDGVKETLTSLKERGLLLGVVTDTFQPTYLKLNWFESAGIGHVWDAIISSCDLGVRKPDPCIYNAALQQLGVQPGEAVFVGHKASELQGAKAVHMTTVAFNYEEGVEADFYIERFSELKELPMLSEGISNA